MKDWEVTVDADGWLVVHPPREAGTPSPDSRDTGEPTATLATSDGHAEIFGDSRRGLGVENPWVDTEYCL